jgi:hypothetical protein
LRVISSSPTDLKLVFNAIARSAGRLCEAFDVVVYSVEGDVLRLVVHHGPMPAGHVPLHRRAIAFELIGPPSPARCARDLSPAEVGFIRLRPPKVPNSGKPEFGWRGRPQLEQLAQQIERFIGRAASAITSPQRGPQRGEVGAEGAG